MPGRAPAASRAKVKSAVAPGAMLPDVGRTRTPGRVLPPTSASAWPGGDETARCRPSVGHVVVPTFFIVTVSRPVDAPGERTSRGAADCATTVASLVAVMCHHDERRPSDRLGHGRAL